MGEDRAKAQASKILGLSKETEFLQSFVRIGISEDEKQDKSAPPRMENLPKQSSFDEYKDPSKQGPSGKPLTGKQIFKQIKQEMKNKENNTKRRRYRRDEEVYTDKDRAAAVNMGNQDIKQSLHAKMKQDRTKALALPEEADSGTLLALGRNELRGGNFEIAIGFVNKALELNPDEKSALVARSKCYLLLGEPKLALDDAETALKIDKGYIKAIYQKAEALYFLGDFELSLMFYHRGLRARPELEGFRLGIQKAQEAIENTIGSSKPLIDLASIDSPASSTPESGCKEAATPTPTKTERKDGDGRLSGKLLGRLRVDKEYLENLLKNPDLNVADRNGNNIAAQAEEAVQFLNKRQEFWRQQRPTAVPSGRKKSSKHNSLGPFPKWYDQHHKL